MPDQWGASGYAQRYLIGKAMEWGQLAPTILEKLSPEVFTDRPLRWPIEAAKEIDAAGADAARLPGAAGGRLGAQDGPDGPRIRAVPGRQTDCPGAVRGTADGPRTGRGPGCVPAAVRVAPGSRSAGEPTSRDYVHERARQRAVDDSGKGGLVMEKTFESTDLYMAAYLMACGMKLEWAEREGRRTVWHFADEVRRPALVKKFYNNEWCASYRRALTDLKSSLYHM